MKKINVPSSGACLILSVLFKKLVVIHCKHAHIFCFQYLIPSKTNLPQQCPPRLIGNTSPLHVQYLIFFVCLASHCLSTTRAYLITNTHGGESCGDSVRAYLPEHQCFPLRFFLQWHSSGCGYCIAGRFITSLRPQYPPNIFVSILYFFYHTVSPPPTVTPPPVNLMFSHFLFPHPLHFLPYPAHFLPHYFPPS